MKRMKTVHQYLIYGGILPFIICGVYLILGKTTFFFLGSIEQLLSTYGLIIISFISGSHWGLHLISKSKCLYVPVLSNIITIIVWISFIILTVKFIFTVFIICFLLLLAIDQKLLQYKIITLLYFRTRCLATTITIITLTITCFYI